MSPKGGSLGTQAFMQSKYAVQPLQRACQATACKCKNGDGVRMLAEKQEKNGEISLNALY